MDVRRSGRLAVAPPAHGKDLGLSAFFVQEEVVRRGDGELVLQTMAGKGFDVILQLGLDDRLRRKLRAWFASNAFDIDPKKLVSVIFAHDLLPVAPTPSEVRDHPLCDNARNLLTRNALETEVNRRSGRRRHYLPARPTESSEQAWSLLTALAPERVGAVEDEIAERLASFPKPPSSTVRDLSRYACRARVELIDFHGVKAVRKAFRPGSERFLQRELDVFQSLGPVCNAIPKLLESGPDYLVMEYIDESEQLPLPPRPGLLPLKQVRQLAAFVRTCIRHGFDPVDLKPRSNALYTVRGLKIIDYEFWRRCDPTMPPEESYCLAGLPDDYEGDRPWGLIFPFSPYPLKWRRVTGLSPKSFLYDPPWLQSLKRVPWAVRARIVRRARTTARRVLRRGERR